MFSFLRNKKRKKPKKAVIEMDVSWFDGHVDQHENIPRVNWDGVYRYVDEHYEVDDLGNVWCSIARHWMAGLVTRLSGDYSTVETDNFLLISSGDKRYNKNLSDFLERCLRRLLFVSKGVFCNDGHGKHIVIVFDGVETYYDYVGYFYGAGGDYGLSSGMYINNGYGHFVFTQQGLHLVEPIAAHEMTHALLDHLPIPLWLNEGLAVNMEAFISGYAPEGFTESIFQLHESFWRDIEVQQFWGGASFSRSDDGQQLSYQLAQVLTRRLSEDQDAFVQFVNNAHWADGGEKSMQDAYGMSLGDLLAGFLGEGSWAPKPDLWSSSGDT